MLMGRRRQTDLDLPPRMRRKGLAYYYDAGGKPRKWIALGSDKPAALLKWADLEGKNTTDTIAGLIDRYLASSFFDALKPSSQYAYRRWSMVLRAVFGHMPPGDLRPHHIATFLDDSPKKALANKQIAVLSAIYEKALRWGVVDINPTRGVRKNSMRPRDRYLTDEEFIAIRSHAAPVLRCMMDIAYLTGMRQGDICKIRRDDLREGALWVTQQKTGKRQAFRLAGALDDAIRAAKALPGGIKGFHLFSTRKGVPYSPKTVQWYWTTACKAAGVENAHFHDIRGKAGTDAKAAGQDHQALLGHANRVMSDRYVKVRETDRVTPLNRKIVEG